jgi:hypothetical protein
MAQKKGHPASATKPACFDLIPCLPCRRSITLVCKRWERLFYAESALWRHFLLRPADPAWPRDRCPDPPAGWVAAKHRQLARVAGLVQAFEAGTEEPDYGRLACCGGRQFSLSAFLSRLRPEALSSAALWWEADAEALQQLPRFPSLTHLLLHYAFELPREAAGVISRMPQLQSLQLHAGDLSEAVMGSVLGLDRKLPLLG